MILALLIAFRSLDPALVAEVAERIQDNNAIILMRHGEQSTSQNGSSPALQKIAMMRAPENKNAPATEDSLAEFEATIEALSSLSREITVESSSNRRAKDPAEKLSSAVHFRLIWDCIDYLPEESLLLQLLPDGTLPWEESLVDAVAGLGTYQRILSDVSREIVPSSSLRVIFTHTQQIQAACQLLGLPLSRLGHYGFLLILPNKAYLYPNGFYKI